ncbi:hypothetical protein FB45DRAFT_1104232 [Roridomyces roridus]|uniref:NACHT domain-containing protein n=1 Tax=Roridomyces roridus TaxID=1738132 RepID=A0AAD7FFC0_9AGAR|nr:hypothetical protein FB45DRAFT_1104232 [Roridomyces roridus]
MDGQISIEKILALVIESAKNAEEQKVLDTIPHADAGYRCVHDLKSEFLPGTRQELFEELNQWLDHPAQRPVYFLSGGAGLGKSSITHQLCTRLDVSADHGPRLGASFFFVRDSGDLESARLFFSSLAHQLALSQLSFRPHIIAAAREYLKRGSRQQMQHTFEELFRRPFQGTAVTLPNPVVLVIDGLDECGERELIPNLLELLLELPTMLPGIRLFLTSRPEPHIQSVLTSASVLPSILYRSLNETVAQWEGDIRLYLEQTVPNMRPYGDFVRDNPDQLERLIKRAAGVFNFARVTVRFLDAYRDHPEEQFTLLLSDGGTGLSALDALYLQILLLAFPPEGWSAPLRAARLRSFLVLIALCSGTLTPEFMACFKLETQLSKADIIGMTDRLRSVLLIDSQGRIVALHATFTEFLLNPKRCAHPLYHIDRATGNALLASAGTVETVNIPLRNYMQYSQQYWHAHLSAAQFTSALKGDFVHFIEIQMPIYMAVTRPVNRGSPDLKGWLSGAEDGTQIIIEHTKSEAYHKLAWKRFLASHCQFPDVSAKDVTEQIQQELGVRYHADLMVSDTDIVRFRAAHNGLIEQIRAAGPEVQEVWLNVAWLGY